VRPAAAFALLLLAACTLLTSFDTEGQPCDLSAPPGSQCLNEFHCEKGKCVKGGLAGGSGTSGGSAGGSTAGGSTAGGSAGGSAMDSGRADAGRTDGGDGG